MPDNRVRYQPMPGKDDNHREGLLLNIFSCQLMSLKLVKHVYQAGRQGGGRSGLLQYFPAVREGGRVE